jgi:hypothetical protein
LGPHRASIISRCGQAFALALAAAQRGFDCIDEARGQALEGDAAAAPAGRPKIDYRGHGEIFHNKNRFIA